MTGELLPRRIPGEVGTAMARVLIVVRLRVEALLEAHDQINNSLEHPRDGSDDRDKPWLA
jgi:hypothetical protein